jgi:hypothetical protein
MAQPSEGLVVSVPVLEWCLGRGALSDWRLSSQLYLKGAAAVGSWTAYRAIAVESGVVDREGNVGETGWELLEARRDWVYLGTWCA